MIFSRLFHRYGSRKAAGSAGRLFPSLSFFQEDPLLFPVVKELHSDIFPCFLLFLRFRRSHDGVIIPFFEIMSTKNFFSFILLFFRQQNVMMMPGSKGQKAVHACMIRLLNLGPAKHEKAAIYAVNQRILNVCRIAGASLQRSNS